MSQPRRMALDEAGINVLVGFGLAVVTQIVVFPWFGLPPRLMDALELGGIFTVVSLARGYRLRRLFERLIR